mgnify:CR=1 FL=1
MGSTRANVRQLVLAFAVLASGCFRTQSETSCECCGTTVAISPGESCSLGVCDSYCGFVPDAGPDGSHPIVCDCCGTNVSTTSGTCWDGTCDPYCGFVPDAGVDAPDAGACEPLAPELTAFDHIPANTATRVQVRKPGCFCGETLHCDVALSGGRTIDLTTTMCTPDLLCDGCNELQTGCDLPPLEEGTWTVRVNGLVAHELTVVPEDIRPEMAEVFVTHADRDRCGLRWPPEDYVPYGACVDPEVHAGLPFAVRVFDECASEVCGNRMGSCEVTVFDRVVRVRARRTVTECDMAACPPVCEPRTDVCWVPPLANGRWTLQFGDVSMPFEAVDDPSPAEACGPP